MHSYISIVFMELTAKIRIEKGQKAKALRQKGILPAVLCRKGKESISLEIDSHDFLKAFKETGETGVIQLTLKEGEKAEKAKNVLIHEIAKDPLTGEIIHVDFQEIRMDEKLTATVPIIFINESPAVKGEGGTLVKNIKEVQVKAFAKDFPRQIEVDISVLKTFDDRIQVKDLLVSSEVKILAQPEETVALVSPPRKEEAVVEVAPAAGEAEKPAEEAAPGEPLAKKEE